MAKMSEETPPIYPSNSTGAHLSITADELVSLRLVARGSVAPSLIIRNGKVLGLHTGELLDRDVVISGRHIAALTPWEYFPKTKHEIDAAGKYVSPGFIDAHIHIEYTKLVPGELARLSVPRGTTTVLADANCIANVLGGKGMDFMGTTSTPLRIFRQVSHKVPMSSPEIELGGTSVSTSEICERVSRSEAATLGESNPFSLDLASAQKQAAALHAGKRITGHTALLENEPLWAYAAGGISDDHNAHKPADVVERLRLGMMLTVMSGSMNSNLPSVFSDFHLYKDGMNHISFCADDKVCEDLDATGHIDFHIREAIRLGVPALKAYRMATLNPAAYYRLDHILGSVTPAKLADLLILDSLEEARPSLVLINGHPVARHNHPLFLNTDPIHPSTLDTVHINPHFFASSAFHLFPRHSAHTTARVRAMDIHSGYFNRAFHVLLPVSPEASGEILADPARDVAKIAVVDRHHGTPHRGIGYVRGFGLRRGALACTTNCENQNLVVVGTSDDEMASAVRAMAALGGGCVAVCGGEVVGRVALEVGGCMAARAWEQVRDESVALDGVVREVLGATAIQYPFLVASFVGLVAVPELGLTEMGLVGGGGEELVDVVLDVERVGGEEEGVKVCCRCPSHAHDVERFMDAATSLE